MSMLVSSQLVNVFNNPELVAELEVFRSDFTFDETPDYSLQVAQQSAVIGLSLVTHDLEPSMWEWHLTFYANFDVDAIAPWLSEWGTWVR